MSEFLTRGRHFSTKHVWFENGEPTIGGCDRLTIHGFGEPKKRLGGRICCESVPQESLISYLSVPEEELWGLMTKTVRNEVSRSEREGVRFVVYRGIEILSGELLNAFAQMYREMYEEKGMPGEVLPVEDLKVYAEQDALIITVAEIDGQPVVYHSYIHDAMHSRLLHSCSQFRAADNAMRNAIGRANKFLHWNDWLLFKKMGIQEYDWGGIASYEEPNGIDRFKMAFGGTYRKYYNLYCDCSLRARAYAALRRMANRR